jgi:hypothetical protein
MSLTDSEFLVLRQTIATRGTVRMALLPLTVVAWAAVAAMLLLWSDLPVAAILPLAILTAGFEATYALHVGVERIGRYVQVYYEAGSSGPQWETTAMLLGPALPGGGIDPLFSIVFLSATIANLTVAVVPEPTPLELGIIGAIHVALAVRIVRARGAASHQRVVELDNYRALKSGQAVPRP